MAVYALEWSSCCLEILPKCCHPRQRGLGLLRIYHISSHSFDSTGSPDKSFRSIRSKRRNVDDLFTSSRKYEQAPVSSGFAFSHMLQVST
ncbi:hypothetical protein Mp_8g18600 [Marchantia polymorpha subsp. ruderalis]|uniref:Uncharacterized protein n=1 Tax=Marchantia polymorpha TaxID=3197 RepID=A0A2R6W125_MARPO|nr:hypothetical protein MARPO_0192s0001 [Marchantia polymorpha]BBN20379.1 hypothetical protein Mp_8g18600 [Marchantia polymorpha subsp. ruderalis]|eukprot:PTQ27561.1 hypothetical protein MARPO_0192s0001 [Marchantia polymorpha]